MRVLPKITMMLIAAALLVGLAAIEATPTPVSANPALPTDLSYSTETTWLLPGLPALSAAAGYIPHTFSQDEVVFQPGGEVIHGFRAGKADENMLSRNLAWSMEAAQYYYPEPYLREPVEAFLHRQNGTTGAIGGTLTPAGRSLKQTITSDEETGLIHAAYLYYTLSYNSAWLQNDIDGQTVIDRLNRAADWLMAHRIDPETGLIWRGHTTAWGQVKFEGGSAPSDFIAGQDHQTVSVYDQSLAYMALLELAEMNAAVGNTDRADTWQNRAEALKGQANALLWQSTPGFYRLHRHVTPLEHAFNEGEMVTIANALAVVAGLTDAAQDRAIFQNLERVRQEAGVNQAGLSLYPYYPAGFFADPAMTPGRFQNGGVWDAWGGLQIKAEFRHGFADLGRAHLLQAANAWQKHPGNLIEWQASAGPAAEGSHYDSAAAGAMGSAIIEGLFGVQLTGQGLTLQPRLGLNDGYVRVYQAATDRYAAYSYDWDQNVTRLDFGTNAGGAVRVMLLKLQSEQVSQVRVDGREVDFRLESIGQDTYTVFEAPGGRHQIELIKNQPVEAVSAAPTVEMAYLTPASPGLARNPAARPQSSEVITAAKLDAAGDDAYTTQKLRDAQKSRQTTLQIASVVLVVFTSLGVIFLAFLRRATGLNYTAHRSEKSHEQRRTE